MYPDSLFLDFDLYTICLSVGLVCVILVLDKFLTKRSVPSRVENFYMIIGIIAIGLGILSANLFQSVYRFFETGEFTLDAGMTFYGGLIGGIVVFFICFFAIGKLIFKEKEHFKYFHDVASVAPCCITVGHAFGRLGCLFAGCCYGKPMNGFPGLKMTVFYHGETVTGYFLPTQLYESIFLFALFAVVSVLYLKKIECTFETYLLSYGVWRFFIEYLRVDDRGVLLPGLTPSQWISVCLIAVGIALIVVKKIKNRKIKTERE